MFKTLFRAFICLLIPVSGLISCNRDTLGTDKDVYHPPLPKIVRSGETRDLKTWDQLTHKDLRLDDIMDLSDSQPEKVSVQSDCIGQNKSYSFHDEFKATLKLAVFQLVHMGLLVEPLEDKSFLCRFEVTLVNSRGSRHVHVFNSLLAGDTRGSVHLGTDESIFQRDQLRGLHIHYSHSEPADGQVYCEDISLKKLPFNQMIDFFNYNFEHPDLRENRPAGILAQRPDQLCRVLILRENKLVAFSRKFTLSYPRALLKIEQPQSLANLPLNSQAGFVQLLLQNQYASSLTYATIRLSNDSDQNKFVQIPPPGSRTARLSLFGELHPYSVGNCPGRTDPRRPEIGRCNVLCNNLTLSYSAHPLQSKGGFNIVQISPHTTLILSLQYQPGGCYHSHQFESVPEAVAVTMKDALPIAELNERLSVFQQWSVSPPAVFFHTAYSVPADQYEALRSVDGCCY